MTAHGGQTGICILRIETEVDRLLITVTTEWHHRRGPVTVAEPRIRRFADAEPAIEAVAEFLRSYRPIRASDL
jgi:hypothetical protein